MGASAEKRKAKKAAQKAYLKALASVKPVDQINRVNTNAARSVKENFEDYGANDVALARKADGIAKGINKNLPSLNESIKAYNDRYDLYQRQRNGESITEYAMETPKDPNLTGMAGYAATPTASKAVNSEAQAQAQVDAYNEKLAEQPQKTTGLLGIGMQNQEQSPLNPVQQAPLTASLKEIKQGPITGSYRTQGATVDAYNDFAALNKNINAAAKTAGLENANQEYEKIAQRLQGNLKRNQSIRPANGLLSGETLDGSPERLVI